jgi:hypothetical protein
VQHLVWREREQERALERRRYIYREGLYAKHVASNRYTGSSTRFEDENRLLG